MLRLLGVVCICVAAFSAFGQSDSGYQVATIVDVKTHQAISEKASDKASYDVSVKVGGTIYVVWYTPPYGIDTVEHKTGRNLLVHVGKNAITYTDLLGQSFDVPIISQKPATLADESK
jgi:hypothetical protein